MHTLCLLLSPRTGQEVDTNLDFTIPEDELGMCTGTTQRPVLEEIC